MSLYMYACSFMSCAQCAQPSPGCSCFRFQRILQLCPKQHIQPCFSGLSKKLCCTVEVVGAHLDQKQHSIIIIIINRTIHRRWAIFSAALRRHNNQSLSSSAVLLNLGLLNRTLHLVVWVLYVGFSSVIILCKTIHSNTKYVILSCTVDQRTIFLYTQETSCTLFPGYIFIDIISVYFYINNLLNYRIISSKWSLLYCDSKKILNFLALLSCLILSLLSL